MPGDPKECRKLCTELAKKDESPARAQVFKNLAKQWLKLAVELERADGLLSEREPKPRKPWTN